MRVPTVRGGVAAALALTAVGAVSAPAVAAPTVPVAPTITHVLHLRSATQQSSNWSGWVAGKLKLGFGSVYGTWTVPTVVNSGGDAYSSTWVGIGGDPTLDLIQAGTEQDWVSGQPVYYAWTEILPEPEFRTSAITVHPGDRMSVSISRKLGEVWTILIKDLSDGQSFTRTTPYTSTFLTAEWIHEAPTVGGFIARLASTSNVAFDLCGAGGQTIGQTSSHQQILLRGSSNATPSGLDSDGDGFAVADGTAAPAPPGS